MKKDHFIIVFPVLFLLAVAAGCAKQPANRPAEITEQEEGLSIVLGDISDDPGEVIEGTQPLARDGRGPLHLADADEMARLLIDGEVDLYFDSVYPATLISDATDAQPILRRWRFGVEEYFTVIFASKVSGIESLTDLQGQMVAFDNPFSTSGFLLPAVTLVEEGYSLAGKPTYDEQISSQEIGFVMMRIPCNGC